MLRKIMLIDNKRIMNDLLSSEAIKGPIMPEEITSMEQVKTAPFDPRFPNTNQTRNCYQNYLDFHRCSKKHGQTDERCQYFKKVYSTICPIAWMEKWDEQVQENRFPGRI